MENTGLDALFITSEDNFRWLTGFNAPVWQNLTRPRYCIVPAHGDPVLILPSGNDVIANRTAAWIRDVRSWAAPNPDDDGVTLVIDALAGYAGAHRRIGAELGRESRVTMPIGDFLRIRDAIAPAQMVDADWMLRTLRMVKSPAEIAIMRHVCQLVSRAFEALPGLVRWRHRARCRRRLPVRGAAQRRREDPLSHLHFRTRRLSVQQHGSERPCAGGRRCPDDRYRRVIRRLLLRLRPRLCLRRSLRAGTPSVRLRVARHRGRDRSGPTGSARLRCLAGAGRGAGGLGQCRCRKGGFRRRPLRSRGGFAHVRATLQQPDRRTTAARGDDAHHRTGSDLPRRRSDEKDKRVLLHEENVVLTATGCELLTRRAPREIPVIA